MKVHYYKYLPISRLSYLEDELLRFTQPGDLNDPFECLPQKPSEEEFNLLIDTVILNLPKVNKEFERNTKDKFNTEYLKDLYKNANKNVNDDIGILSLSKNWNNTLMWSHYTNSHKGFCIGFDKNHNFFENYLSDDKCTSKFIKEVEYSETRVKIPMILGQEKLNFEPYITKSLDWKYEEEIRIISSLNSADEIKPKEPYNIHLFKVSHSCITQIILGANIEIENENEIRKFASEKNIEIYKAKISDTKYNMERE